MKRLALSNRPQVVYLKLQKRVETERKWRCCKIYATFMSSWFASPHRAERSRRMFVTTVYNYIHVGNARSTVAFDTICRFWVSWLKLQHFQSQMDEASLTAEEEASHPQEVADKYIAASEDVTALMKPVWSGARKT